MVTPRGCAKHGFEDGYMNERQWLCRICRRITTAKWKAQKRAERRAARPGPETLACPVHGQENGYLRNRKRNGKEYPQWVCRICLNATMRRQYQDRKARAQATT